MNSFEEYLQNCLNNIKDSKVKEAMLYSLLAGGKRIRPQLLFSALKAYGIAEEKGFPCAAAIEMIHTYSIIHDDLPAMDDDTLRRGRPTCHIQFDEATAILAGDALLTQAFHEVLKSDATASQLVSLESLISSYSGANGMVLGQIYDLEAEGRCDVSIEALQRVHEYKTGKLITLPLLCAAVLANHEEDFEVWKSIGYAMGLSFQIQDDVFDVTSTCEELGKDIMSDAGNHKSTYVSLLGVERATQLAQEYYDQAWQHCLALRIDHSAMKPVFDALIKRKK